MSDGGWRSRVAAHFDFNFLNSSRFFWILPMSSCCFSASCFPCFTSSRLVLINSLVSFTVFDILGNSTEIIYWGQSVGGGRVTTSGV